MGNTETLPALIASLLDPRNYDHPAEPVELIETHISWILLAGEFAYKIKKPVDLGFLDFTTLGRRRSRCEDELRLNRRLAPEIYLEVLPIGGTPQTPRWGDDQAIEYAVKMRRFPQAAQLDRMLEGRELTLRHMESFAGLIADFHQRVEVAGEDTTYGDPDVVFEAVAENFPPPRAQLVDPDGRAVIDCVEDWSREAFARLKSEVARRKHDGFVRECHGDLHLRNLAWVDDRPLAFDCIEFNPQLRWIDVMSDVAFLVMDLQSRAQSGLSARFLNRYLEHCGDYAGLAVLRFYMVYRAVVRAKVDAIRAGQPGVDAAGKSAALTDCRHYLRLAESYTRPQQQRLILTCGPSASGKSTVSLPLADALGAVRIRSDVERKRLHGIAPGDSASAGPGQGLYSREASDRTYRRLLQLAGLALDAGFSVIVDAASLQAGQRQPFQSLAAAKQARYAILEFRAPADTLRERIRRRTRGVSDADIVVLERQLDTMQPLSASEQPHAIVVDTSEAIDHATLAKKIKAQFR